MKEIEKKIEYILDCHVKTMYREGKFKECAKQILALFDGGKSPEEVEKLLLELSQELEDATQKIVSNAIDEAEALCNKLREQDRQEMIDSIDPEAQLTKKCEECGGSGKKGNYGHPINMFIKPDCPKCKGEGEIEEKARVKCPICLDIGFRTCNSEKGWHDKCDCKDGEKKAWVKCEHWRDASPPMYEWEFCTKAKKTIYDIEVCLINIPLKYCTHKDGWIPATYENILALLEKAGELRWE
jgi:hypothetical protein